MNTYISLVATTTPPPSYSLSSPSLWLFLERSSMHSCSHRYVSLCYPYKARCNISDLICFFFNRITYSPPFHFGITIFSKNLSILPNKIGFVELGPNKVFRPRMKYDIYVSPRKPSEASNFSCFSVVDFPRILLHSLSFFRSFVHSLSHSPSSGSLTHSPALFPHTHTYTPIHLFETTSQSSIKIWIKNHRKICRCVFYICKIPISNHLACLRTGIWALNTVRARHK